MRILLLVFFFISILSSNSNSEDKIVFLNVNYIYNNSVSGSEANKSINKKIKELENEVKKFTKNINENKEKLIKQKNILSEEDFKKKLDDIDVKVKSYNKQIKKNNEIIVKLKKDIRSKFIEELSIILKEYSKQNSIQLIIEQENVLIGSNKLNITNEILKIVDSKKIKLIN